MAKISEAYQYHNSNGTITWCRVFSFAAILTFTGIIGYKFAATPSFISDLGTIVGSSDSTGKHINAVTWNVAAINNNPFEYWITNEDPKYNQLMKKVSSFINSPGEFDVKVKEVFTEEMFNSLEKEMLLVGWKGVNETRQFWQSDFSNRKIISEFVKDSVLGKKRLASMPDRVTNTIHTSSGGSAMRPTVINCYEGDLGSLDKWWQQWRQFYFHDSIDLKRGGKVVPTHIYEMISKIKKAKYPTITEEEEAVSIPLQTLCMAIFDSVLVNMMQHVGKDSWQPLRADICQKLNHKKKDRTVEILQTTYADADVQFLQEMAGDFMSFAKKQPIYELFDVYQSASMDPDRDQNSFILLKKGKYTDVVEVTDKVFALFSQQNDGSKLPAANGDLLVLLATDALDGAKYLLASFHGDTNGLATKPVVSAVRSYAVSQQPTCKMLFGLDANTYARPEKDQQGVVDFGKFYTELKLNSCYGPSPNPLNFTTFHARTHLQPQLNKAVTLEEKDVKGDKNPKDFILFFASDYRVQRTTKDNTGRKVYIDGMVFPTLSFPSDHGITSTLLLEVDPLQQQQASSASAGGGGSLPSPTKHLKGSTK
eukprot:CAMPEP_0181296048 /NCGR_PEP_ID=MMETSP1101-20121128/4483_1 /TAXON_ID=46948 /ORGANISM="Rhodomonas abbreviata, Strain Caron Lab Isolate" /LENGTH=593 /DNA_ID=CAMNT_0023400861 /DNA_START=84 /DNA_END=1865 /DNA_ORIENTATION=-